MLWALSAAGTQAAMEEVRVFATEPACFEYLFTGVVSASDGQPLLAFNNRNGRTAFVKVGEALGPFRVAAFEPQNRRVYNSSLNAYLDQPAGKVTLAGAGGVAIVLEQDQHLPQPGYVAWLIRLDNGLWWNVQEQDVFFMEDQPVFVEEVDADGITVTAGQDLAFVRRISSGEKKDLQRFWADQKRREQKTRELALQRQPETAKSKAAATTDDKASYFTYDRGTHVELRGPARYFYGTEYRFPTEFKALPSFQYVNGRLISSYVVTPSRFETRYSGVLLIAK